MGRWIDNCKNTGNKWFVLTTEGGHQRSDLFITYEKQEMNNEMKVCWRYQVVQSHTLSANKEVLQDFKTERIVADIHEEIAQYSTAVKW